MFNLLTRADERSKVYLFERLNLQIYREASDEDIGEYIITDYQAGYQQAVEDLIDAGLLDRDKID